MTLTFHESFGYQRTNFNYSVSSDSDYFEFSTPLWRKVHKHPIKKIGKRQYFGSKIYLPTLYFSVEKYQNKEYDLIRLKHPIRIKDYGYIGLGFLLFIHDPNNDAPFEAHVNKNNEYFNFRSKKKRFMIHKRKSKGKEYESLKIFVPNMLFGKKVSIYRYIPSLNIALKYGEKKEDTVPGIQGKNSWGNNEYGGPSPPSGTHRYIFKLYALDTTLNLKEGATKQEVENAMKEHIIEQAKLVGLYQKQ